MGNNDKFYISILGIIAFVICVFICCVTTYNINETNKKFSAIEKMTVLATSIDNK